jgi:predicted dehydrogenase
MRRTDEFSVALVGCGGVVRLYRKLYGRLPGVRVAVAIDVDEAEARQAAAESGADRASIDFSDALSNEIDVVVISTPNDLHLEQAVAALNAGKHVLLQKPMARTVAECDEILAAARASGKTLGIYMNMLDHPLYRDFQAMAQSGYLGEVALVSARLAHRGGLIWQGGEKNWRSSKARTGGGAFVQLAAHYHHLIRWILDDTIVRVQAFMKNIACPHLEGDDLGMAHLELASGAYADVQTSWCVQEEHLSILGTRGAIHYRDNRTVEYLGEGGPFNGRTLKLEGRGAQEIITPLTPPEWDDVNNPFNQHRRFFSALAEGRKPDVTGEVGREDVRILQACYQSAQEERVIYL